MHINLTNQTCTLVRDEDDKALRKENQVTHAIKRLLQTKGHHAARRRGPVGLTACTQVLHSKTLNAHIWHERYAVEMAHKEFNHGSVTYTVTPDSK